MTTLKAGPFKGMYTTLHDEAPMDMAHYLLNLIPRGSEVVQRPPVRRWSSETIASATIQTAGTFMSGTGFLPWVLTSEPALYIYNPATEALTVAVSAANFTTATVVATNSAYWVQYNGEIVFAQGDGTPWMWDGTAGAGSLTLLTNAGTVDSLHSLQCTTARCSLSRVMDERLFGVRRTMLPLDMKPVVTITLGRYRNHLSIHFVP